MVIGRILFVLIGAVLFYCLMYICREEKLVSVFSGAFSHKSSYNKRSERSSESHSQPAYGQCVLGHLSEEHQLTLKRLVNPKKARTLRSVVHCSVINSCQSYHYHVDCFSNTCDSFDVHVKGSSHVIQSLSRDELSDFIETSLHQKTFMVVDDLNQYFDVTCSGPVAFRIKITGDFVSRDICETIHGFQGLKLVQDKNNLKKHIHVLYFRFLSRQELQVYFPGLFSLLMDSKRKRHIGLLDGDTYQATKWRNDELLSLLFQGKTGPFDYENSLLHSLHNEGYCFRLQDFSCHKSRAQENFVANITSRDMAVICRDNPVRHHQILIEKLCSMGNITDSKMRTMLTSLLLNLHHLDGQQTDVRPVFTVSILNIRDFKHVEVMDHVLRNVFTSFMNQENRLMVMLSGVGNPSFLRLDLSVRLQLQASNPVMMICSTFNTSLDSSSQVSRLSKSVFSLRNIYQLLQSFVKNQPYSETSQHRTVSEDLLNNTLNTCKDLNVTPPLLCLCEDQLVGYKNDSLMTGFAELVIGTINKRLQDLIPVSVPEKKQSEVHCSRVSGTSFGNAQIGQAKDRMRIVMDLNLVDDLSTEPTSFHAILDIWDLNKNPSSKLRVYKHRTVCPTSLEIQDLVWETLCKRGENLSFHTSSEAAILQHWTEERHFGRAAKMTNLHDTCLFLLVRDFGDSASMEAANVCSDRSYEVTLHLSLINMVCVNPLPLTVRLGHVHREFVAAVVKVSYTVAKFAYKVVADFDVKYDD